MIAFLTVVFCISSAKLICNNSFCVTLPLVPVKLNSCSSVVAVPELKFVGNVIDPEPSVPPVLVIVLIVEPA